jgi:hypothetical protein
MNQDNAQRAAGSSAPACSTCRFWKPPCGDDEGVCRRRAPVRTQATSGWMIYGTGFFSRGCNETWPATEATDWCGEYESSNNDLSGGR